MNEKFAFVLLFVFLMGFSIFNITYFLANRRKRKSGRWILRIRGILGLCTLIGCMLGYKFLKGL